MTSAAPTYKTPIKGTTFSVTRAMLLMPPMITAPTASAAISPKSHALLAKNEASPPVTLTTC